MGPNRNQYHCYFPRRFQTLSTVAVFGSRRSLKNWILRVSLLIVGMAFICFVARPAMGAGPMDPEADRILRSMSSYMGSLTSFSVKADVDIEIIDLAGQKLQFSSSVDIVVNRPNKIYFSRQGAIADIEFIYNGKTMTLYGRNLNVFFQKALTGTTDTVIETLQNEIGFSAPGADLFYSNNYDRLAEGVLSSDYLGTSFVNGIECHYLAFREAQVDWQLWINAEGDPLPMKYIITTKWLTGAPQYAVRFRDWNTSPKIKKDQFEFKAPKGARRIEEIHVDEMGELVIEEVE